MTFKPWKVRFTEGTRWGSNLRINIPDVISAGRYNIEIYNTNKNPLPVSISISSFAKSAQVYPIEMHSYVIQITVKIILSLNFKTKIFEWFLK